MFSENLQIKKGRGLKSKLSFKQLVELKNVISLPIRTDDGYTRGWQSKDVRIYILKNYKIEYSIIRIREILRILGFRKIVCRPKNKRRNEELTQEFLNNTKKNEIYWVKDTL
jgi:transposase